MIVSNEMSRGDLTAKINFTEQITLPLIFLNELLGLVMHGYKNLHGAILTKMNIIKRDQKEIL